MAPSTPTPSPQQHELLLPDIPITQAEAKAFGSGNTVVAVTGAGGYVASHLVARLLAAGATVRACVRSLSSAEHLRELEKRYGKNATSACNKKQQRQQQQLEIFTGCDLLVPGSFDAALSNGVEYVFHTASPFQMAGKGEELLNAAVGGTREVLSACARVGGPSLKRVVLTSSVAALHAFVPADRAGEGKQPYGPGDWNTGSSTSYFPYEHSKAAAERWAWRFVHAASGGEADVPPEALEEAGDAATAVNHHHGNDADAEDETGAAQTAAALGLGLEGSPAAVNSKKQTRSSTTSTPSNSNNNKIRWSLSVVNPGFVLGPPLASRADGESVGIACKLLQDGMLGAWPDVHFGACDVRDVAAVHALAAVTPCAAGKRLIVAPHRSSFGDLVSAVKSDPELLPRVRLPRRAAFYPVLLALSPLLSFMGLPPYRVRLTYGVPAATYDCSLAEGLLRAGDGKKGSVWTPRDRTVTDMARALLARGLVKDQQAGRA